MTITIYDERLSGAYGYKPGAIITWSFTTDASGDVTEQTSVIINGRSNRIVTNPDNSDTPTTSWDLTITDEDGVDILSTTGANRDAADTGASEQIVLGATNPVVASKVTFTVANGGNAKKGVVKLYLI